MQTDRETDRLTDWIDEREDEGKKVLHSLLTISAASLPSYLQRNLIKYYLFFNREAYL